MIPALKKNKEASVSAPPSVIKREPDEEAPFDALEAAAEDFSRALESKDYKGMAAAWRAAFQIFDSEPHEEGEHIG